MVMNSTKENNSGNMENKCLGQGRGCYLKCGSQKKPTKTLVIEQGPGGVVGLSRYLGEVKLGAEQAVSVSNRQGEVRKMV